jgi:hypothetical protein
MINNARILPADEPKLPNVVTINTLPTLFLKNTL